MCVCVLIDLFLLETHYHITVEPLNNGHGGDEHFVHCSEVVPSSEVEMYGQLMAGGKQFGRLSSYQSVHYRRFYCTLNKFENLLVLIFGL